VITLSLLPLPFVLLQQVTLVFETPRPASDLQLKLPAHNGASRFAGWSCKQLVILHTACCTSFLQSSSSLIPSGSERLTHYPRVSLLPLDEGGHCQLMARPNCSRFISHIRSWMIPILSRYVRAATSCPDTSPFGHFVDHSDFFIQCFFRSAWGRIDGYEYNTLDSDLTR
jgi:hypothetical protein